jgi:hypothetical protein
MPASSILVMPSGYSILTPPLPSDFRFSIGATLLPCPHRAPRVGDRLARSPLSHGFAPGWRQLALRLGRLDWLSCRPGPHLLSKCHQASSRYPKSYSMLLWLMVPYIRFKPKSEQEIADVTWNHTPHPARHLLAWRVQRSFRWLRLWLWSRRRRCNRHNSDRCPRATSYGSTLTK